jgi:hypothetical protein
LDALPMPTQRLGTIYERPLIELAFLILAHLFGAGLADIDDSQALQVGRRDLEVAGSE